MFNLTDDQKTAIELQFITMVAQGWITYEQAETAKRYLFDLPPFSPEQDSAEEVWLDNIAPTPEEYALMHTRHHSREKHDVPKVQNRL